MDGELLLIPGLQCIFSLHPCIHIHHMSLWDCCCSRHIRQRALFIQAPWRPNENSPKSRLPGYRSRVVDGREL